MRTLDVVRCLVKEIGADVNRTTHDGSTRAALMAASNGNHEEVRNWLKKHGANSQTLSALDVSKACGGSAEQTAHS
jgi:hypothetical protein